MAVHVTIDIVLRNGMQIVPPGTFEFTTFVWMPMVVFLPLAHASMGNDHIRMPLLIDKLSSSVSRYADLLISLVSLLLITLLVVMQFESTRHSFLNSQVTNGSIQLPIWLGKGIALVGLSLMVLALLDQTISSAIKLSRSHDVEESEKRKHAPKFFWVFVFVSASALGIFTYISLIPSSREVLSVLGLMLLFALIAMGVPIGISLVVASIVGIEKILGADALLTSVPELLFKAGANWQLSVIPLFVVVGSVLWSSGIASKAFHTIVSFFGRAPGGLAVSANVSGAGLAAVSGSSIGITYALGRIAIPEMLKRKYSPAMATASVAMAGTLGQIIPPSIQLVVYAGIVQVSVGKQLFAGILPGLLLATAFALYIIIVAQLKPNLMPKEQSRLSWGSRLRTLPGILPIIIIFFVIIGGIASGVFTVTEAAAVGAIAAALIALLMRRFPDGQRVKAEDAEVRNGYASSMKKALDTSVTSIASIFLLLIGVYVFTRFLTVTRITNLVAGFVVNLGLPYLVFILVLIVIFVILGAFLDPLAMILITVPILSGSFSHYNIDPIWFGVFVIIMAEVAMVTPPVGILSFVVHKIAQEPEVNHGVEVRLTHVFGGVLGFVCIALAVVVVLALFPEIVLWLPELLAQ